MKKIYKKPFAEVVNIKLLGTILDDPHPPVRPYSNYTLDGDAKENDLVFEDDAWDSDPWSDGGNTTDPYELWGE